MAWFSKKPDPLSDRARALNDEIAHLDAQIKQLDSQLQRQQVQPRLRSTALPHGATLSYSTPAPPPAPPQVPQAAQEPIFEEVDHAIPDAPDSGVTTPEHYNELGVRKYDLLALFHRIRNHFRGPSTTNPKLVSYLAAGGIQGLRPLRYEKRVARNRLIFFVIFLFLMLLGTIWVFVRHR
jgi:hypothetical protein